MERRKVLRLVSLAGVGLVTDGAGIGSGKLDLDTAAARTVQLRSEYADGQSEALARLEDHAYALRFGARMAKGSNDHRRALLLFGDAAQSVSLLMYKALDYQSARWWADETQMAAEKASDVDLVAVALVRRAMVSIGMGKPEFAASLMGSALGIGAGPHASALVEIHLARALSARAETPFGGDDDIDQALRALDRAQAAVERADRQGRPTPPWANGLGNAWMAYHRGDVLAHHKPKEASLLLIGATQQLRGNRQTRGSAQVRMAEAAAALGGPEQAVSVAVNALTIVSTGGAWREVHRSSGCASTSLTRCRRAS